MLTRKSMRKNNFYISCIVYFVCLYFLLFFKYILFIIRVYTDKNIIFWEWFFLYDNLKTTIIVYFPYFLISWLRYKYNLKERENSLFKNR